MRAITYIFGCIAFLVLFGTLTPSCFNNSERYRAYFLRGISGYTEEITGSCASSNGNNDATGSRENCVESYERGGRIRTMVLDENPDNRVAAFDRLIGSTRSTEQELLRRLTREELRNRRPEQGTILGLRNLNVDLVDSDAVIGILYQNRQMNTKIPPSYSQWPVFGGCMLLAYLFMGGIVLSLCLGSSKYRLSFEGLDNPSVKITVFVFCPFWFAAQVLLVVIYSPVWVLKFLANKYPPAEKKEAEKESFGKEPYRATVVDVLPDEERWTTVWWRWICRKVTKAA